MYQPHKPLEKTFLNNNFRQLDSFSVNKNLPSKIVLFAKMQKPLTAFRVDRPQGATKNQVISKINLVVTGAWSAIRVILKHGFAQLRGGDEHFLQICKKCSERGTRDEGPDKSDKDPIKKGLHTVVATLWIYQ